MKLKRILTLLLCTSLLAGGCLTACRKNPEPPVDTDGGTTPPVDQNTTGGGNGNVDPDPEIPEPTLTGPYADTIMLSNRMADKVQSYYTDPKRSGYRIENSHMSLTYGLTEAGKMLVNSLENTKGQAYLTDTMDVFITMEDGQTYTASSSTVSAYTNVYRMGYYYYDAHIMGQNFMGGAAIGAEMPFTMNRSTIRGNDVAAMSIKDGVVAYDVSGNDPYIYTISNKTKEGLCFPAAEYNAVQFSVRTKATSGELYFVAGSKPSHNSDQSTRFDLIGDNEWHTYTVVINTVTDYTDIVTSLRFDIGNLGDHVEIKEIKAVNLETDAPAILLDRTFHTYSDKMNQVLHFVASEPVEGIKGMGTVTTIAADTVAKLTVKDAKGTHTSLGDADFATCEYVGFDIKGVGVLGFILLPHENSGKLEVTLKDGVYTVTQTSCPKDGKMAANPDSTADDFYMGCRIYTDDSHDFTAFLKEAEIERKPLTSVSGENYLGYDALRGAYKFSIGSTGFNDPFFTEWNRHYSADVTVEGDGTDRTIYVYTYATGGCGENAVILDKNGMLLPIPTMIYKNFKGENEEPVFDPGDPSYSETYFPVSVKAGSKIQLTVLNLYQNWGLLPLKQLSSIQFFWPYYHLSLGTTETSCINPLYGAKDLWALPDFRSLSMPYWFELPKDGGYSNQPQHTHGGYQYFLQYTDKDGHYSATENFHNDIISSGPVYTDVKMDYISDDGRIKVSYNHLELPETDELRAYYEIRYEVLEDVSFANFVKDFSFYSLEGYAGSYRKMGYLNDKNQIVQKSVNSSPNPEILKLGTDHPYLSMYDLNTTDPSFVHNNVNLGFVIYDSEFTIGGKACDAGFVAVGQNSKYSLSLDLGEVTLKKGDTMTIGMIISPWGFYTSTDDKNMQAIRENTCLMGVKLTVQDGEAMDSMFIPKVKSQNGKSAEFTISGGSNNKAVRVYGFDTLTAPTVYEKVGGKWVELTVNSAASPDKKGNAHSYDGYAVYYDRNGTYSYAFGFSMDGTDSRTFKIVADKAFAGWPEEGVQQDSSLKIHVDAESIKLATQTEAHGIDRAELSEDKSYIRIYGYGDGSGESFFTPFKNSDMSPTGHYLIVKCRVPETNSTPAEFEFFISTTHAGAHAGDSFVMRNIPADGQWHYLIADLTQQNLPTFETDSSGSYTALHLRFDVFNVTTAKDQYVDIGYVGLANSLEEIANFQKEGVGEIYKGGSVSDTLDFSTGSSQTPDQSESNDPKDFVDPASGYHVSDVRYSAMIDFINGKGDGDGPYDARGTGSGRSLDKIAYNDVTLTDGKLALAGWSIAEGGVADYVWSADGGKTWQACSLYNRTSFDDVTTNKGISDAANQFFSASGYKVSEHPDKIVFQGEEGTPSGVCADLSAFNGQTVDVIFAVVPNADANGLCLMAVIKGVQVVVE